MSETSFRKGKQIKATSLPDLNSSFSPELLAQCITAKRTQLKLRIVDVADALSLSKQTVVKIEKGDPKVNFINILKVMEYLGISFQLITDDGSSVAGDENNDEWF